MAICTSNRVYNFWPCVRIADLYHPAGSANTWAGSSTTRTGCWTAMLPDFTPFDPRPWPTNTSDYAERLRPYVRDTTTWLHEAVAQGRRLMFEGAQGSLLDVDHGSYPYVTSSNSSAAGIAAGLGRADAAHRPLDRRRQGVHHAGRRRAVPRTA